MPLSGNGCGTQLVKASKPVWIDGQLQFDAVEAVTLLYLPLIPLRAVRVLEFHGSEIEGRYVAVLHSTPWNVIARAYLNRWGNVLLFFGVFATALFSFAAGNMMRAFNRTDLTFLTAFASMAAFGLACKAARWSLSIEAERTDGQKAALACLPFVLLIVVAVTASPAWQRRHQALPGNSAPPVQAHDPVEVAIPLSDLVDFELLTREPPQFDPPVSSESPFTLQSILEQSKSQSGEVRGQVDEPLK